MFCPNAEENGGEFIYSPQGKVLHKTAKLFFQAGENTESSTLVSFEKEGIQTQLNVPAQAIRQGNKEYKPVYLFVVSIKNGPDNYWRTKYATVTPRYLISNLALTNIFFRQSSNGYIHQLPPGASNHQVHLSYFDPNQPTPCLSFNISNEDKFNWTDTIPLNLVLSPFFLPSPLLSSLHSFFPSFLSPLPFPSFLPSPLHSLPFPSLLRCLPFQIHLVSYHFQYLPPFLPTFFPSSFSHSTLPHSSFHSLPSFLPFSPPSFSHSSLPSPLPSFPPFRPPSFHSTPPPLPPLIAFPFLLFL